MAFTETTYQHLWLIYNCVNKKIYNQSIVVINFWFKDTAFKFWTMAILISLTLGIQIDLADR